MKFCALFSVLFYLFCATQASAEIYRWVDDRGNVHFTDEPPENKDVQLLNPQTQELGVEIVKPEQLQQWNERDKNPRPEFPKAADSGGQVAPANSKLNESNVDICAGVVGDCFSDQQDYVCKLRFGIECQTLYHWKVCLHQNCNDRKIADKCDSPYQLLSRRPIVITQRDIDRPLPLRENVSDQDWNCLTQHGFFCEEVAFEESCQKNYRRSCSELKNWVPSGLETCKKQRGSDCNDIDTLLHYRPVSVVESKKAGTLLANGNILSQDLFLQSIQADRDDPEQYPQLWMLLDSLTGLNIQAGQRQRFDCLRNTTTDVRF